jgi:hypothetical protein
VSERPALVAIALALGRVLDNPRAQSSHAGVARELTRVLDKALKQQLRPRKLAAVRSLSDRKGGA